MARKKGPQVMEAFEYIQNKILTFEIKPSEMISYSRVAEVLNMSRTPVKEAVMMLQHEGLVESDSNHRPFAARLVFSDLRDLIEVREAIELEAVRIIEKNGGLNSAQVEELRYHSCRTDDDLFHVIIVRCTGNARLASMFESIRQQNARVRCLNIIRPERWKEAEREHKEIFKALFACNYEKAAKSVSTHLYAMFNEYERILKSGAFCSVITSMAKESGNG